MQAALPDQIRLAPWARTLRPSTIHRMLAITARPGLTSFALGLPAPELFPAEAYARAAARVLATDPAALQYGPSFRPLKEIIAALMARRGVRCRPEQVVLTSGAHQGLSVLARILLEEGGEVMTERVTYTGFLQVIEPFRPRILSVPTSSTTGIDVDAVERALAGGASPAFLYVVTDGHNPLGVSLSVESRERLVELARRYRVPIVEDDAYGPLRYGDSSVPPLRALDDRWVLYVGSFSKILAPSCRVGWVIAPEELVPALVGAKDACDLDMNTFSQRVVAAFVADGHMEGHLRSLREEYAVRRDLMVEGVRAHFPVGTRCVVPSHGTLLWAELPREVDCERLLPVAVETERVAFVPGAAFTADDSSYASNCMRLNFSYPGREEIVRGMEALGRAVRTAAA